MNRNLIVGLMIDHLRMGGAQKILVQLALELKKKAINVVVLSISDRDPVLADPLIQADIPIHYFPGGSLASPGRVKQITAFLKQQKIDVLHTHLTYANILGCFVSKLTNIPVIVSIHSTRADRRNFSKLHIWIETLMIRLFAHTILAHGHRIAETNRERFGRRQIQIIPNAVRDIPDLSESERRLLRESLSLSDECKVLISVGRMSLPKGYLDLIESFALVHSRVPDTKLLIIGDGFLRPQMENLIRERKLDRAVIMPGWRDDVPSLLGAADIYVSASHWEGLSVAILEGMASGLPVAATDVGDNHRMVSPDTGLLVPPGDSNALGKAVLNLLLDPGKSRAMGAAARAHVRQAYNFDDWVSRYEALYLMTGGIA